MINDPLVSADWLAVNIDTPAVRVLDATWVPPFLKYRPNGRTNYLSGHIPGAVYFDIDDIADKNSGLNHMLPGEDEFGDLVGTLGISNSDHVVAYDNNGFFASARVWWMFRAMGHDHVHVLDGGLSAWTHAGGRLESAINQPAGSTFAASRRATLIRDQQDMRSHVETQDASVLDARDVGRFNGTSPEPRAGLPSGHMPGSFCVPASSLITPDKALESEAVLRSALGSFVDSPVITSCGSGVSAAVIALALARLGNWDAALYDGSWSEWAANSDNPIATLP